MGGWIVDLACYLISVILRQWTGDYENLLEMKHILSADRFLIQVGFEPSTL